MVGNPTKVRKMSNNLEINSGLWKYYFYTIIIWHLPGLGRVPYHPGKTETTPRITRSREVNNPTGRYQQFFSTPNSQKVRAVSRLTIYVKPLFFSKKKVIKDTLCRIPLRGRFAANLLPVTILKFSSPDFRIVTGPNCFLQRVPPLQICQILWNFLPVTIVKIWSPEIDLPVTDERGVSNQKGPVV